MNPEPTALSPAVHAYLARIKGAHGFVVDFLSSDDFKQMQEFAKDFGGIVLDLPGASCPVELNAFGVLTFRAGNGQTYAITQKRPDEEERCYLGRAREFILGLREWVFPGWDSFGSSQTLIQGCYDTVTTRVNLAMSGQRATDRTSPHSRAGSRHPGKD